jgi:hypothetical protein
MRRTTHGVVVQIKSYCKAALVAPSRVKQAGPINAAACGPLAKKEEFVFLNNQKENKAGGGHLSKISRSISTDGGK